MGVTLENIARDLKVSIATVSRALSSTKRNGLSDETRRLILEAAQRLGYQRRKTNSRSVAFIIDKSAFSLASEFYAEVISGVEEELAKQGHFFQFIAVESNELEYQKVNMNLGDLAGVILIGVFDDKFVRHLENINIPMILVDYYLPTENTETILIDNADGILRACRYLYDIGHRRVAYISGARNQLSADDRLYAFKRAQEMFGFDRDPVLLEPSSPKMKGGFNAMDKILRKSRRPPTAVVAHNDIIAIGAMDAIKLHGLSIPGDISVCGFDDIRHAADVVPSLSTVHVPIRTIGKIAVHRILQAISGKRDLIRKILIPTRLVIRDSIASAKRQ